MRGMVPAKTFFEHCIRRCVASIKGCTHFWYVSRLFVMMGVAGMIAENIAVQSKRGYISSTIQATRAQSRNCDDD